MPLWCGSRNKKLEMHGIEIETEWADDVYFLSQQTLIGESKVKLDI